jgi:predicted enzyme related to lactoylglutathione lyase
MSSEKTEPKFGTVAWQDLTVPNAEQVRDFYQEVIGWISQPLDMGGYDDFVMVTPANDQGVAGICHARGVNADLPPQWLLYFLVEDLDASIAKCIRSGGTVLRYPTSVGNSRFGVIRDPAGAVCGLYAAS